VVIGQGTLEELVIMFGNRYKNRRVLITGHTGFKGSWLALWLQILGAKVTGISLPAETTPNHWKLLGLDAESFNIDIRDAELLRRKVVESKPEIVFHLAAQPLVRRSYRQPLETWATNVMGTANLLDACMHVEGLQAIVVITTDKCYENKEWIWGYRELDPLGCHDPYSASKAGSELVAASYRLSFFNTPSSPLLATARAGNVIGGGDWSEDRLIPDLIRSVKGGKSLEIRSPNATRPWQHVLECLSGYLMLGQQLLEGDKAFAVLTAIKADWPSVAWHCSAASQPHEAQLLHLDSDKAREKLGWRPVWNFDEGVAMTAAWYRALMEQDTVLSIEQLQTYINLAGERGLPWVREAAI